MTIAVRIFDMILKNLVDDEDFEGFLRMIIWEDIVGNDYVDETDDSFVSAIVAVGNFGLIEQVVEGAPLEAISAQNKKGFAALDWAFLLPKENPEREAIIKLLIGNNARAGYAALNQFITNGDLVGVKEIVDHVVSIHARDANGKTPLVLAAEHGRLEVVLFLVKERKFFSFSSNHKQEIEEATDIAATMGYNEITSYLSSIR